MARGRTKGAFGLARVDVERSWMKRCKELGVEPGAELAQMFADAIKVKDARAALVILNAAHRFISPPPDADGQAQGSFALTWQEPLALAAEFRALDDLSLVVARQ